VKRGSAYWINLEPSSPPELGKVRPGIVVSNSIQNERLDSVVIVPLSSRAPEIWPLGFRVELPGMKASYAVIPGIRQVSKSRPLGLHRRDSSRGDGADRRRARNLPRRPKLVAASAWRKRDTAIGGRARRRRTSYQSVRSGY